MAAAEAEPAKKRRIVEDEDEEMDDAPAIAPAVKENRAQPLPGQQEEFSPELLRM